RQLPTCRDPPDGAKLEARGAPSRGPGASEGSRRRRTTMKANFSFVSVPSERTIRLRMQGEFDARSMSRFAEEYRRVCEEYSGRPHMVLADMRGTAPLKATTAEIFGEIIAYSRRRGVV